MTHQFKPGDRVRIVRKGTDDEMKGRGWTGSMDRFIGTTQVIEATTKQNDTPGYMIEDGGWDFPECILEKAEELPAKTEQPRFKAGDKVRFISCEPLDHEITGSPFYCEADELKIGEIYTIREVSSRGNYYLEGKKFSHDPRRFEAVSSEPAWKKFKAGDKVRCMHLNDIPGESDCESGRKPYFYLEKGGIYTVKHINVECKQDNADFYISLVEDVTILHPGRFELVEKKEIIEDKPVEKKNSIIIDDVDNVWKDSFPYSMVSVLGEEQKKLAELRKKAMDKVWRDEIASRQRFFASWVMKPEISDEDLLLLL